MKASFEANNLGSLAIKTWRENRERTPPVVWRILIEKLAKTLWIWTNSQQARLMISQEEASITTPDIKSLFMYVEGEKVPTRKEEKVLAAVKGWYQYVCAEEIKDEDCCLKL